jgi:hypothetical protein
VFRQGTDRKMGCHASRAQALKQQRALYANEPSARTASLSDVFPLKPPKSWFEVPEAGQLTPLTVTADGQVYGHLAPWGTCHTGFPGECVQAPRGSDYRLFHVGRLETAEGDEIPVGKITYHTSHAPITAGADETRAHYDHSGQVGAFIRATDGAYGVWVSGAVKSDITPEGLRDLKANPLSGDWRRIGSALELVAALAVPVPGFPIPMALAASGEVSALVMPGVSDEKGYSASKQALGIEVGIRRGRDYQRKRTLISSSLSAKD